MAPIIISKYDLANELGVRKMKLRHYTLNTGDMAEANVFEEDKELYFTMKKIINRAKKQSS